MEKSCEDWSAIRDDPAERNKWLAASFRKLTSPHGISLTELPPIRWKDGTPAPIANVLKAVEERVPYGDPAIDEILNDLDPHSMTQLTLVLFQRLEQTYLASKKWVMSMVPRWGNDEAVRMLGQLARHLQEAGKNMRFTESIFVLADCHRHDQALRELEYFISNSKTAGPKEKAMRALLEIAEARNVSFRELRDQVVSTHGFDAGGAKIIDLGRQKLVATILPNLTIELRNEKDKVIRSIPKGGKEDDPAKRAEAAEWLANSRKELKRFAAEQASRLEEMMIAGFEWSAPLWRSRFIDRPLLGILAQRILWTARNPIAKTSRTFRVAEDLTFADENDDELKLDEAEIVTIAHPLNWTDDQRATWQQIAADYNLSPLFPQWDRETFLPTDEERRGGEITRFYGRTVDHRQLRSRLARNGWQMGRIQESGGTSLFHYRAFLPSEEALLNAGKSTMDDLTIDAFCFHDPISIAPNYTEAIDVPLAHVIFAKGGNYKDITTWKLNELASGNSRLVIADVPSQIFSETMRDVAMLVGGTTD